jgi:hypothetical protein
MSNELESDSAMVMNLESSFGVDGAGYDETETDSDRVRVGAAKFDKPAVKIMLQVTQIVQAASARPSARVLKSTGMACRRGASFHW